MRVTRERAAASRERILDAAARLFRSRGLDGIGVADIMKGAGLTHGGFYGHFESKEELMELACRRALGTSVEKWGRVAAEAGARTVAEIARSYLSTRHRDNPATGCAVAALAADASRQGPAVRKALSAGIESQVQVLARAAPGRAGKAARRRALAAYAAMVGAMVLARAIDDPKRSKEMLDAVAATLEASGSGR